MVVGKVKTRLAKSIGDEAALQVYREMVAITEKATHNNDADIQVYYSTKVESNTWTRATKKIQRGNDLGEKMLNAFSDGFSEGYKNIVLIGSDLPDMSASILNQAFNQLKNKSVVFGPAEDGGYYLVGLSALESNIFENKPWSKSHLLSTTLQELKDQRVEFSLLDTLNDIDTYEDLVSSSIYNKYSITILSS